MLSKPATRMKHSGKAEVQVECDANTAAAVAQYGTCQGADVKEGTPEGCAYTKNLLSGCTVGSTITGGGAAAPKCYYDKRRLEDVQMV